MDGTPSRLSRWSMLVLSLSCLMLTSCETLKAPGSAADWFARNTKGHEREAQAYRTQWQTRKDAGAIRWLLATQVHNGLSPEEVNERLGDTGKLEPNAQEFKRRGDGLRIDDELYGYGPDRKGEVYYLAFRDGKLTNFEPELFAEGK